jgi:hypothetical protein
LLTALRCALASARAACLLQEHRHLQDHRLRVPLAVLAELATTGQVAAPRQAAAQLAAVLAALEISAEETDTVTAAALQAVAHAARAALAVLEHRPWRFVDQYARHAYEHMMWAVDRAQEVPPGPDAVQRVAAALAGQHSQASALARSLWPARENTPRR